MAGMWYVLAVAAVVACATAQQNFTLEEIVNAHFAQRGFTGQWISDTRFSYTIPNEPGIFAYDCETDTSEVMVSGDLMAQLNTSNPIVSPDENYILASQDVQQVYRYSRTARYALFNVQTGQTTQVADDKRLQLCIFGGSQHALAYVYQNNLYYLHNSNASPIAITNDGIEGVVYNGHTDWVYEEDVMYTGQATWFSTNASYLAFATFNDTEVESYSYYYYTDSDHEPYLYPKLVDLKYPKVGRRNPTVVLRVVNLAQLVANPTNPNFIKMEAPADVTDDHILGGVTWLTDNEIAMHWTNRRQNYSVLQICNVETSFCEEERREEPRGWIPLALPRFSKDGRYYVSLRWSLRQADDMVWQHLYVSMRVNGEIVSSSVSPGAFSVINFIGMVEQTEESPDTLAFYYTRTMTNMPWQSEVCVSGATDKCFSRNLVLPDGGPCTRTSATLSPGGSFMTITCESPEEPSATYIMNLKDETKTPVVWEANNIVRQRLVGKARWGSIITTVPLQDGFPAPVRLLLPPGLDVNDTNTKYPVVFYVYSGPNTNTVFNTFTVGYHSYLTTSRDIIYMLADGRGSGLKGQDILFSLNNALGTVEVEDHFVILKQVLDRYPFMDRTRVGIWGHSYGGYATLLTMLKDDEKLFQCGVSGAPVTSWLYYNTMYTERYMGLPTEEDNLKGYQAGDVTLLAEKLRGHDFFIMHGNADDNVHYQNAVKLNKALQDLNIPFEQMSYPDEAHSLSGVNLHRYHAMDRYWTRCLRL